MWHSYSLTMIIELCIVESRWTNQQRKACMRTFIKKESLLFHRWISPQWKFFSGRTTNPVPCIFLEMMMTSVLSTPEAFSSSMKKGNFGISLVGSYFGGNIYWLSDECWIINEEFRVTIAGLLGTCNQRQ